LRRRRIFYRILFRKRPEIPEHAPTLIDKASAAIMMLTGASFMLWGMGGLLGVLPTAVSIGYGLAPFYVIGIVVGLGVARFGFADWHAFDARPADKRWWWDEHMQRFLSAYTATVTAFMVQNVRRNMPDGFE
jgi:hypothetical protein